MFTGIIEKQGKVIQFEAIGSPVGHGPKPSMKLVLRLERLALSSTFSNIALGESIAVNGVCLTVTEFSSAEGEVTFFVSPESLDRSNLGSITKNSLVNLERALT